MYISRILFVAILFIFSCDETLKQTLDPTEDSTDCAGVVDGDSVEDNCGTCDNDSTNDCIQDCAGIWGGDNVCGCNDNTKCNYDTTVTINDGSCVAQQGCNDWCEGNPEGIQKLDCNDDCGGSAVLDNCGICDNDSTNDCIYETVQIGEQTWISENLKVTHYNNGDTILYSDGNWTNLTDGAYVVYDNAPSNIDIYGNLYNWYAVNDARGLCPVGWHVPSYDEYTVLTDSLGGTSVAGGKMKSTGTIEGGDGLWNEPNEGATNESGFTALPSGYYSDEGFKHLGSTGYFWSEDQALGQFLDTESDNLIRIPSSRSSYYSIRCIKD